MEKESRNKKDLPEREKFSTENQSNVENSKKEPISYPLIATTIPICIIVGFLIGDFLDKWLGTSPIFLIIFIIMGAIAAYRQLLKLVKKD